MKVREARVINVLMRICGLTQFLVVMGLILSNRYGPSAYPFIWECFMYGKGFEWPRFA